MQKNNAFLRHSWQNPDTQGMLLSPMIEITDQQFGIVKPVILNGNGMLIVGHQRVKALKSLGLQVTPAIVLKEISLEDEIRFNLFHNSVETNGSNVTMTDIASLPEGYHWIPPHQIQVNDKNNISILYEIETLLVKYGPWGSVIIDETGKVIENADYAVACEQLKQPLLLYKMSNAKAQAFQPFLTVSYRSYSFEQLGVKAYNQLYVQMNRLREMKTGTRSFKSTTYEHLVLPYLKK